MSIRREKAGGGPPDNGTPDDQADPADTGDLIAVDDSAVGSTGADVSPLRDSAESGGPGEPDSDRRHRL
jgi:hypothetical protein